MKKGKVFSKRHIITATLAVCLAAAVWLNMKFSSIDTAVEGSDSGLGDSKYFDDSTLGEAVQASAGVDKIASARADRERERDSALSELKALINDSSAEKADKQKALERLGETAESISDEISIETVIKAKGFSDALAVVSDESVTVIVPADSLLTSETLQIQDAVRSVRDVELEKIKIITVK